jgi:hypothetical protein
MLRSYQNLFDVMAAAVQGTAGEPIPSRNAELPSPWESWTTISLIRQRDRQIWGRSVVERLDRSIPEGTIPGLSEWEFRFHGLGCCLTHKVTGEEIETETGEGFDFYFWIRNLKSVKSPGPDVRRMVELHPSLRSLGLTLNKLREAKLIDADGEPVGRWVVAEEAVAHTQTVRDYCQLLAEESKRRHLHEIVGDSADGEAIHRQRAKRLADINRYFEGSEMLRVESLYALADLDGEELSARLRDVLKSRPWSPLTYVAVEVIAERNDPTWCDAVYRVFNEVTPPDEIPQPAIWIECAKFLLKHDYRTEEILAGLQLAGRTALGKAAILGLEYGKTPPTALFRRALLSPEAAPLDRTEAAAALAVLDTPWSRDLLLSVLRESTSHDVTAESRAALRECHGPDCAAAADDWEKNRPVSGSESFLERHFDVTNWVRHNMEDLHDRVYPLRQRFSH